MTCSDYNCNVFHDDNDTSLQHLSNSFLSPVVAGVCDPLAGVVVLAVPPVTRLLRAAVPPTLALKQGGTEKYEA